MLMNYGIAYLRMHERRLPKCRLSKAFRERLRHLRHMGGAGRVHYDVVDGDDDVTNRRSAEEGTGCWCSWMSQCSVGCLSLVGAGQAQGNGNSSRQDRGAGEDDRASRSVHLAAVEGLHWPEGPHHWLPIVEVDVREGSQLEEDNTASETRPLTWLLHRRSEVMIFRIHR